MDRVYGFIWGEGCTPDLQQKIKGEDFNTTNKNVLIFYGQ